MKKHDWFRNERWNSEIERQFFEKLRRARDKAQYLKLQAGCLAKREPKVALMLLQRFFEVKDDFWLADVCTIQAEAYLALDNISEAVASFKAAIQREREYPNHVTTAWYQFALLVAEKKLAPEYDEVLRLLEERRGDLIFPVLVFARSSGLALIHSERGDLEKARFHALQALDAARKGHSGLRYHAKIGLVGPEYRSVRKHVERLTKTSPLKRLIPWRNR